MLRHVSTAHAALERLADGPAAKYLAALAVFACSRLLVGLGIYLGTFFEPTPAPWSTGNPWLDPLMRFDAGWYLSILRDGYHAVPPDGSQGTLAFFPLYPLLAALVTRLAGLGDAAALLTVANLAALASLLLMVKVGAARFGERPAVFAAAAFSFFPTSLFLSAGYSESTCIALVLASLLALENRHFALAALAAGAATAARTPGLAMAPVVAYAAIRQNGGRAAFYGAAACWGLLLFIAYQAWAFGDPLGFVAAQRAWSHESLPANLLKGATLVALWPIRPALAWLALPLGLLVFNRRYLGPELFAYGLAVLLIPYFTVGVTPSAPRFALLCVPLFFCLARLLRPRPLLSAVYFSLSAGLLVMNAAKFSQWHFVA